VHCAPIKAVAGSTAGPIPSYAGRLKGLLLTASFDCTVRLWSTAPSLSTAAWAPLKQLADKHPSALVSLSILARLLGSRKRAEEVFKAMHQSLSEKDIAAGELALFLKQVCPARGVRPVINTAVKSARRAPRGRRAAAPRYLRFA
jgi:hypothetical protein